MPVLFHSLKNTKTLLLLQSKSKCYSMTIFVVSSSFTSIYGISACTGVCEIKLLPHRVTKQTTTQLTFFVKIF